jgi:hypothetical protein
MPGTLAGGHFKSLINALLFAGVIAPEVRARIEAMRVDDQYPWDEFTGLAQDLAQKIPAGVLTTVGKKVCHGAVDTFRALGFDDAESILRDYRTFFEIIVVDAPARDAPETLMFEPGHVVITAGTTLPGPLLEGFFRGIVEAYGGRVETCNVSVDPRGSRAVSFEMHYRKRANRPVSGAYVMPPRDR